MSGSAVPEGFTLPWNTTRTMADVWAAERLEAQRARARRMNAVRRERHEQLLEARPVYVTSESKVAFAGYDRTERA